MLWVICGRRLNYRPGLGSGWLSSWRRWGFVLGSKGEKRRIVIFGTCRSPNLSIYKRNPHNKFQHHSRHRKRYKPHSRSTKSSASLYSTY